MKKAIALLATLVVLTSTAFAQLAPTISGSAETKWGMDLDDETDGFELDTDITVTVPLFGTEILTGEGEGAYGDISLTGASLTFTLDLDSIDGDDFFLVEDLNDEDSALKGTEADVSAKLDFGNGAYVTIGTDSDLEANYVSGDKDYWVNPSFDEDAGLSLGYAQDMFSFELTVVNEADGYAATEEDNATDEGYRDDTDVVAEDKIVNVGEVTVDDTAAESEDGYFLGGKAMFTAGDIFTANVAVATNATGTLLDDSAKKTGVAVEVVSVPMEGLTFTVPFDYLAADAGNAMEIMPAVSYTTGALTLSTDFHYISVAKELDAGVAAVTASGAVEEVIPAGYTKVTIDEVVYLSNDTTGVVYLASAVAGYTAAADAVAAVDASGLTEDFISQQLNATVAYALDAGTASLTVGSALGAMDADMDLDVAVSWTADVYNVALDLGDVLLEDGLNEVGLDFGFTGVTGLTATVETTLVNGDVAFGLDNFNLDFDSAITGLENTVLTFNYSDFATDDTGTAGDQSAKGVFYVGAKISL